MARIIHTDNFGGDYPDEKFVEGLPRLQIEAMKRIAKAINNELPESHSRYYMAVEDDYQLLPGFEP